MKKYTWRNYWAYIKDNPKGYWFKMRLYGWGWVPAKWQGLIVILLFIILLLANGFYLASKAVPTDTDLMIFLGVTILLVALLFVICYAKGESPKWSWGR